MQTFRIHGDNIVECERIANLILTTLKPEYIKTFLTSPSTTTIEIKGSYLNNSIHWTMELLPGFNKNTKRRWKKNIFDALKEAGSFLDETPDAIISRIKDANEQIILGIEFCSALQAGNQAWQRSGRAFSTGRTGCPYLYIVDFVKYELDNNTRQRKNLRFPNPSVPYSYINYSKTTGNFIAQLYTKSEEFDKSKDASIASFEESNFGDDILGTYIVKLMLELNSSQEEEIILKKNMNVVKFLAKHFDSNINFTPDEWQEIYSSKYNDIVDYAVERKRFGFHKTIAAKSQHGVSSRVINLVDQLSVGLASRDLPFGIIPANSRKTFAAHLSKLYPDAKPDIFEVIGLSDRHLIVAIFKGFKPKGDDNRPDRGLLPLAAMLSSTNVDVMAYIYGPMLEANLKLLDSEPTKLADRNGLWHSILALSNYIVLDVPVLAKKKYDTNRIYNTTKIKESYTAIGIEKNLKEKPVFPSIPVSFGEDDVDTGIHYLFNHILGSYCFEGMCNPPGGDWSGFSVIDGNYENRWLSLPRVSNVINGKRPDHIIELFGVFDTPLLLSIESKERSIDLESDVGTKLVTYIKRIMEFVPSAKRQIIPSIGQWTWGDKKINFNNFEIISAAAYLKNYAEASNVVFKKNCEILFVMAPIINGKKIGWEIEIIPSTNRGAKVKDFICNKYKASNDCQFFIY